MQNTLERRYPGLAAALPRMTLAEGPTPVSRQTLAVDGRHTTLSVKCDNLTSPLYGGNKVRKLEYLLARAKQRGATRIATFGAIASNHAMATSVFAQRAGFSCTAFLAHQTRTPATARSLNRHLQIGTRLVRIGGDREHFLATMRAELFSEKTWVVPMGGTCWLGTLGYVDAGLELAEQVSAGELPEPQALYVAMGTMGTVAGLTLGLALGGLGTEVQAVRVTPERDANEPGLHKLIEKTASLMRRLDPSLPADLAARCRVRYRPEFYGEGYAKTNPETDRAVAIAAEQCGLSLEPTYTGKTFRALLEDRQRRGRDEVLFWNTYNSVPLGTTTRRPDDTTGLPEEFLSYFDDPE